MYNNINYLYKTESMNRRNQISNNRVNKFYDDYDFDFDTEIAQDIIDEDSNFVVVLYRIDRNHTNYNDVYGESNRNEIIYQPPIELKVLLTLATANVNTYNKNSGTLRNESFGNLEFTVQQSELKRKNVDIIYGDIIGLPVDGNLVYFSVSDPNYMTSTTQMLYNIKTYFRKIKCVIINKNEFNG